VKADGSEPPGRLRHLRGNSAYPERPHHPHSSSSHHTPPPPNNCVPITRERAHDDASVAAPRTLRHERHPSKSIQKARERNLP
jgi:hypothetical protein